MSVVGLALIANTENWVERARCRKTGPNDEVWFPEAFKRANPAKRICSGCEVRNECLQYALKNGERAGVWGGYTTKERQTMRPNKRPFHHDKCVCSVCTRRRSA